MGCNLLLKIYQFPFLFPVSEMLASGQQETSAPNDPPCSYASDSCTTKIKTNWTSLEYFPFSPKFWKFQLEITWSIPFRLGPTGVFGTTFEGGPFWLVWSFRLVGPKCPFPFEKIVVPSTPLLHPAYENNNQMRGSLGQVCATGMYHSIGHVKFPKFQTGIYV